MTTERQSAASDGSFWWLLECGHYGRGAFAYTKSVTLVLCEVCKRKRGKVKRVNAE